MKKNNQQFKKKYRLYQNKIWDFPLRGKRKSEREKENLNLNLKINLGTMYQLCITKNKQNIYVNLFY